jgi:hypothetical protein
VRATLRAATAVAVEAADHSPAPKTEPMRRPRPTVTVAQAPAAIADIRACGKSGVATAAQASAVLPAGRNLAMTAVPRGRCLSVARNLISSRMMLAELRIGVRILARVRRGAW